VTVKETPLSPISVTLALGSDSYQQVLPQALLREGMLRRVLSFRPEPEIAEPNETGGLGVVKRFPAFRTVNRLMWAAWKRLPGTRRSHLPKVASAWLADQLAAKYVPCSTIFHGFSGTCFACMRVARRFGALTLLESPTVHLQHWQEEVSSECERFGIDPRNCASMLPASLIRRAQREYDLCHRIIVLSTAARRSFERAGYAEKAIVVLPGVDHRFFAPLKEPVLAPLFRACYVGRCEVAKGVGYLLDAWKRLGLRGAELVLAGDVRAETAALLRSHAGARVIVRGALSPSEVAETYRQSNVLVFPSANEGFGMVLLEAMSSGLPVITTDRTGGPDVITDGKDGFVVPASDADALAEKILWCYSHRVESGALGKAARKKIEQRFTIAHYEERQIGLYRQLTQDLRESTVFGAASQNLAG
jgi:glycosyltransferase involved in cell wall biosynthesis